MGKDIDRNITRQLWERLKNTFSKNDVIPIENGGTGENNNLDAFRKLIDNDTYIRDIQNTYKNPNLDSIIDGVVYINKKSIYIDMYGEANILDDSINTFTIFAMSNINELKGIKSDFICSLYSTHVYIDNGSLTITINKNPSYSKIQGTNAKAFILY